MKNNAISSIVWLSTIILSLILLPVGLALENFLVYLAPFLFFLIVYGILYYLTNSYVVYRKFINLEINPRKNLKLVFFPFLIHFFKKELYKEKFFYSNFLKFVTIIIPLITAFVLSGLFNTYLILVTIGAIENNSFFRDRFIIVMFFSFVYGWGFIGLCVIFFFSTLVTLDNTGFYDAKQNVFKKIWKTIFLYFYFPKFYFEQQGVRKRKHKVSSLDSF